MCNFFLSIFTFLQNVYSILLIVYFLKYQSNTFLDFINDDPIKNNEKINNINNKEKLLLLKQNEEYKNKINELENIIKELEIKIIEKDNLIKEEEIKKLDLTKKIKEFENISNNIIELENEIKLFRTYYKFSSNEKLISIKFISTNQEINLTVITKNTDDFTNIEKILYKRYPKYKDSENYFLVNGRKINRNRTLEENKIRNNDVLTLQINNFD